MRDTQMSEFKYFKTKEFACKCCGKILINSNLIKMLDLAREILGKPIKIESGFRCKKHNAEVGGSPTSAHLDGDAADLRCIGDENRYLLVLALLSAGFTRIGLGKNFIHVDISKKKNPERIWLYLIQEEK